MILGRYLTSLKKVPSSVILTDHMAIMFFSLTEVTKAEFSYFFALKRPAGNPNPWSVIFP